MSAMALQFALNRVFVVTANMGSVFEEPAIESNWIQEFAKLVEQADPDLVALHCQEIGGKDFETDMYRVNEFVGKLKELACFSNFDRTRGWFDTNYKDQDAFTALGSIYLIHKRVEPVFLWNFTSEEFHEVKGDQVVFNCSSSSDHFHCKTKFPEDFYPEVRWSRKGYLHTRWKMFGSRLLNFVNIHLFHDDDNIVALDKSPSIYSHHRRRALKYSLDNILTSLKNEPEPLYIYGDFNFRLDLCNFSKLLVTQSCGSRETVENGPSSKVVFHGQEKEGKALLTVERRKFRLNCWSQFTEKYKEMIQFDREPSQFDELKELPLDFQPSYPFSEDLERGSDYMEKRCPGWCDRILMNEPGMKLVAESPLGCMYNMMARTVCVGDHKPIYLFFTIASTEPMKSLPDENSDA